MTTPPDVPSRQDRRVGDRPRRMMTIWEGVALGGAALITGLLIGAYFIHLEPSTRTPVAESTVPSNGSDAEDVEKRPREETHQASTEESAEEAVAREEPLADPASPQDGDVFQLGEMIEFASMKITYMDVKIVDSLEKSSGGVFSPENGEILILLESEFTNPGPETVDLSCAGVPDAYIQMFDHENSEIAPEFDTYEIAGNPECNEQLLKGQSSQWNTLWRSTEGSQPGYLIITDMNSMDEIGIVLDDSIELVGQ